MASFCNFERNCNSVGAPINWNRATIDDLYKSVYPKISHWIRKNSGGEKDAEDIFQEALVSVFQKSKSSDFQLNCKLSTFVFGVAKKMWLYRLRAKGRFVVKDLQLEEELTSSEEKSILEVLHQNEIENVYRKYFKQLSEECKKILTHFFNGLSMKEIVVKMGFTGEALARKKKFNCKNKLVELVKADARYAELTK